jgi:hypothetical protein
LCIFSQRIRKDGTRDFNAELFIAPEPFYEKSRRLPPYPSVSNYDAKLWQFVMEKGQEGDYIWNVGGDDSKILPVECRGGVPDGDEHSDSDKYDGQRKRKGWSGYAKPANDHRQSQSQSQSQSQWDGQDERKRARFS